MGDTKNEINHERKGGNSLVNKYMAKVEMESKFESTKRKLQESYKNINKVFFYFLFLSKKDLKLII